MMQFKMVNDWILLQEFDSEETMTETGLLVGAEALPQVGRATVLEISPSLSKEFKDKDGAQISVGDQVLFSKYQSEDVKIKDEEGKWLERTKIAYKFAIQAKITD